MWNETLVGALVNSGFTQSKCDHFLFINMMDSVTFIVLVYVDDIIIIGNDLLEIILLSNC